MKTFKQKKLFATLIVIFSLVACQTEDVPTSSNELVPNGANKSLNKDNKEADNLNATSTVPFQIVSFTQLKISSSCYKYAWATMGESNISKIELQTSIGGGDWATRYTKDITNTDDSIQNFTTPSDICSGSGCKGQKTIVKSRLKITYQDSSITPSFSNELKYSFNGTFCCKCFP